MGHPLWDAAMVATSPFPRRKNIIESTTFKLLAQGLLGVCKGWLAFPSLCIEKGTQRPGLLELQPTLGVPASLKHVHDAHNEPSKVAALGIPNLILGKVPETLRPSIPTFPKSYCS